MLDIIRFAAVERSVEGVGRRDGFQNSSTNIRRARGAYVVSMILCSLCKISVAVDRDTPASTNNKAYEACVVIAEAVANLSTGATLT